MCLASRVLWLRLGFGEGVLPFPRSAAIGRTSAGTTTAPAAQTGEPPPRAVPREACLSERPSYTGHQACDRQSAPAGCGVGPPSEVERVIPVDRGVSSCMQSNVDFGSARVLPAEMNARGAGRLKLGSGSSR